MGKGVVSIGCSYTWGEGLQFYADLHDTMFRETHMFTIEDVRESHILFKNKNVFSTLVANHYNTWSYLQAKNGGSNMGNYKNHLPQLLDSNNDVRPEDIGLLIFQFTKPDRDYERYYNPNQPYTLENQITILDELFCKFEKKGIKVVTICWDEETSNNKLYLKLYNHRTVNFEIDGVIKSAYDYFILHDEYNMTVRSDFKKFKYQINDLHFNVKGHRFIADSIIKKLEQDNFKINTQVDVTEEYITKNKQWHNQNSHLT